VQAYSVMLAGASRTGECEKTGQRFFFQRASAARRAMSWRFFLESFLARAGPPFNPPTRPSILAASLRCSVVGSPFPEGSVRFSPPVALSTIRFAATFGSSSAGLCLRGFFFRERSGIDNMLMDRGRIRKDVSLEREGLLT